jgi:isocitrate/isopropylmalate dehydrogenase
MADLCVCAARTPDLGGKASTTDFTQGIIRRMNQ